MDDADQILKDLDSLPKISVAAGETIFEQGTHSDFLVFLVEGSVEVVSDGMIVAHESRPGSVYGELSILLDNPHMAEVRAAKDSVLIKVPNPLAYFAEHPRVTLLVCRTIAERLTAATRYMADVRRQFSKDEGHVAMLDKILMTLIHRNPKSVTEERTAIRPDH